MPINYWSENKNTTCLLCKITTGVLTKAVVSCRWDSNIFKEYSLTEWFCPVWFWLSDPTTCTKWCRHTIRSSLLCNFDWVIPPAEVRLVQVALFREYSLKILWGSSWPITSQHFKLLTNQKPWFWQIFGKKVRMTDPASWNYDWVLPPRGATPVGIGPFRHLVWLSGPAPWSDTGGSGSF